VGRRVVRAGEGRQLAVQRQGAQAQEDDRAEAQVEDPPSAGWSALLRLLRSVQVQQVHDGAGGQCCHTLFFGEHGRGRQKRRGEAPAAQLAVGRQAGQVEQAGQHVGPARHAGHRLAVNRVDSKEEAGHPSRARSHPASAEVDIKPGDGGMEEDVCEVELGGRLAGRGQQPVQPEGEGGERPVGLVGPGVGQGHTPVVRLEEVGQGRRAHYAWMGEHRLPEI